MIFAGRNFSGFIVTGTLRASMHWSTKRYGGGDACSARFAA